MQLAGSSTTRNKHKRNMAETITKQKRKESRTLQLSDEQMRGVAGGCHSATAPKQEQTLRHRTCPANRHLARIIGRTVLLQTLN